MLVWKTHSRLLGVRALSLLVVRKERDASHSSFHLTRGLQSDRDVTFVNVAFVKIEFSVVWKSAMYFAHGGKVRFENNVSDAMVAITAMWPVLMLRKAMQVAMTRVLDVFPE